MPSTRQIEALHLSVTNAERSACNDHQARSVILTEICGRVLVAWFVG